MPLALKINFNFMPSFFLLIFVGVGTRFNFISVGNLPNPGIPTSNSTRQTKVDLVVMEILVNVQRCQVLVYHFCDEG